MASIDWDETAPSDNTTGSLVDNSIRGFMVETRTGLREAMYWNTTGSLASTGEMKPGRWRSTHTDLEAGSRDMLKGGAANGYIGLWDNTSMSHVGSENTFCFASHVMEECATEPSNAPYTTRWVLSEGSFQVTFNNGNSGVEKLHDAVTTEYGVTYNGVPFVFLQNVAMAGTPGTDQLFTGTDQPLTTTFISRISVRDLQLDGDVTETFLWRSVGTVTY